MSTRFDSASVAGAGAHSDLSGVTSTQHHTAVVPVFTESFTSSEQTITSNGALTLAHSLSGRPKLVQATLVCKTTSRGYSVGDQLIIDIGRQYGETTQEDQGIGVRVDTSNVYVEYGKGGAVFGVIQVGDSTEENVNNVDWRLVIRAFF
jgi:hypothetical protein